MGASHRLWESCTALQVIGSGERYDAPPMIMGVAS